METLLLGLIKILAVILVAVPVVIIMAAGGTLALLAVALTYGFIRSKLRGGIDE